MEYFIIAVLAFIIGYKVSEIFHVISFKKILEDLGVDGQQLKKLHNRLAEEHGLAPYPENSAAAANSGKTVIEIKIEQVQGQLFAYDLIKESFIAQGRDGDELLQRILDKYPTNVRVICDVANGGKLINDAAERLASKNN
jgi:hypothetical protein